MSTGGRLPSLDLLRFVAILIVVLTHSLRLSEEQYGHTVATVSDFLKHGWIGVDLFFVLSGFLVSGLLYQEYQKHGSLSVKRFLVRRGLKIYPAFYFMIAVTFVVDVIQSMRPVISLPGTTRQYLAEIFFLQNYLGGVWGPTWSLAVEEHFYLTFPFLLILLIKTAPDKTRPFELLKTIFIAIFAFSIFHDVLLHFLPGAASPFYIGDSLVLTHVRLDGLLLGALISYYYHFDRSKLEWIDNHKIACLVIAALLLYFSVFTTVLSPLLVSTFRYLVLAFGLIVAVSVLSERMAKFGESTIGRFFAYIGRHSYSIYLWHVPIIYFLRYMFTGQQVDGGYALAIDLIYFPSAFIFGIAISKLIEIPFLRMRNRYFPGRNTTASSDHSAPIGAAEAG